ncbi:MAG: chorismate synthase [Candidatus Saccharibacteria bacterium]
MLKIQTAGESHGPGLITVIDGLPAGLEIETVYINEQLKRRQQGYGRGGRMKIESDQAEFLSGVRNGLTLGSPVTMMIRNRDYENWQETMSAAPGAKKDRQVHRPRPGHADLAGGMKYGHNDFRNVLERTSARETAARVAAGAICRKLLAEVNIEIYSRVIAIGQVCSECLEWAMTTENQLAIESSPVACTDEKAALQMINAIDQARENGESLGGVFELAACNVPPGLGSYVQWDQRLDSRIAAAMAGIPAIKAVELGEGVKAASSPGSQVHDEIFYSEDQGLYRTSNNAGGIEGGISNGEPILVRAYMKPIPTLYKPLISVNIQSWEAEKAEIERSDICAVPAARVVGEAVLCQVLASELVTKFGGDTMEELRNNFINYINYLKKVWRWKRTSY